MQNKYKLPDDVRKTMLGIVKGYNRRQEEIRRREDEICSANGGRYETYIVGGEEQRVFTPSGKGSTSSPVERQAAALAKYHESDFNYLANKAIDEALSSLPLNKYHSAEKIRKTILNSCKYYRKYPFGYSGIDEISEKTFYNYRNMFLYFLAKKLDYF